MKDGSKHFTYSYDFGDDWQHTIEIEDVADAGPSKEYPRFIDGERRAPPEDVSGWPGFEEFIAAMTKPCHPASARLTQRYGRVFELDDIGAYDINRAIGKLARRRTIGEASFAKSRGQLD